MPNKVTLRHGKNSQRMIAILSAIVLALESGCVTQPVVPKTHYQTTLGRVAVVAISQAPEIKFEGFIHSKGEGAIKNAGGTFMSCMGGMGGGMGGCADAGCGLAVALFTVFCGAAGVVGGVAGAVATPSTDEVQTAEANISTAMAPNTIQEALREQIVSAASANGASLVSVSPESAQAAAQLHDYRSLAAKGVDAVLEVALTKVGLVSLDMVGRETDGSSFGPSLSLSMTAHVRLIRASDNMELLATDYIHLGEKLKPSEWTANQAEPLLQALQGGYKVLGAYIYDNVFLLYPFPAWKEQSAGFLANAFGLAPLNPRLSGPEARDAFLFLPPSFWTTVDSLHPTLIWQAFPREMDIKAAPEEMGRVKNVRYDLVIARAHNLAPAEVVYQREGLSDTKHTLSTSLKLDTRYFWTVRARFELDGRERVTEWSTISFWIRGQWTSPSQWSYRFKTP